MKKVSGICVLVLSILAAISQGQEIASKPNIVVIYTDDHGWPDIGAVGVYEDLKTPHLDALAKAGVRATSGYSTAPQCVPSRAGLLIGKFQSRFGVESNGDSLDGFNAEQTIAERLKKAGYSTGQIGKWHLGSTNKITDHGFDDVYAKNANRPCHANFTLDGKTIPMGLVNDGLYHLDACSKAAVTFIKRHAEKPFFLYLAYRAPHVPLDAPKKYLQRFPGEMPERRRQALAMIAAMDDGVGEIVGELRKSGMEKNTLIFFIGDNGAPLKIHKLDAPGGGPGWDGSLNKPMNGEKGMLAEGGIRVPFLISWPGKIPGGQVYNKAVISLDVAATAVALAGLPKDESLDGVNLMPYLSGKEDGEPHDFLTWRWVAQSAVRSGKWKLLRGGDREYLYNLEEDEGEMKNVLSAHPEVAKRLRGVLKDWSKELKPPGLKSGQMPTVWEDYFDFYLDRKEPAPPRQPKVAEKKKELPAVVQGWIARGATLKSESDGLRVNPLDKAKGQPFLVMSKLELAGPHTVRIRMSSLEEGRAGIAWRNNGQTDFVAGQQEWVEISRTGNVADHEIKTQGDGKTIHLRVHLPPGETLIESIEIVDSEGKVANSWRFRDS